MKKSKTTNTHKFYVTGMHCASCEDIICNLVADIKGVKKVNISRQDSLIQIENHPKEQVSIDDINHRLKDFGYELTAQKQSSGFSKESYFLSFVVGVIIIISYLILNDIGVINDYTMPFIAPDNKETLNLLLSFFILGVVASLTSCTTIVGGIITALSRKWASNQQKSLIIKFHFGRLISFLVFGTILGLLGGFFQISINIMSFFTIIISLLMIIIGLQILQIPFFKSFSFTNLSVFLPKLFKDKLANKRAPYYFGGLTFFIPCGFTLIAQSMAVISGNPVTSGLLMLSFAIGTLPSLIILSLTGYLLGKRSELSDAFSILTSIAIIIFSLYTINSQLNVLGFLSINDFLNNDNKQIFGSSMTLGSKIINSSEGQKQNITVLAKEFEYYPPALKLKADVKSTLTVISQNVEGCAQAMWLGGMHDKPIYLASTGKTQFEFVPRKGKYKISCTMGMVSPITVTVE